MFSGGFLRRPCGPGSRSRLSARQSWAAQALCRPAAADRLTQAIPFAFAQRPVQSLPPIGLADRLRLAQLSGERCLDRKLGNQENGSMKTTLELPDALV